MSTTRGGPGDKAISEHARDTFGRIRRFAITLTTRVLWQIKGHRLPDGTIETHDSEPFTGIGFYSRPPSSAKPEAIVVYPGEGARSPLIAALRDERTRAALFALAGALAEDETAIFNSKGLYVLKADGTQEARSATGVALQLATKADLDALANWIKTTMIVTTPGAGNSTPGTFNNPPAAAGTQKFKAE